MEHLKLNTQNLPEILGHIQIPSYNRSKVKAGIVHVGVGGFHRAHEAFYTNELLQKGETDWGICGVALLDFDQKIYNVLKDQDGLYTLIVKELNGDMNVQVIGSIVEYLFAPENPLAVIEKMANPETKIITLTITEGGYNFNEATGEFQIENPLVQHDLKNPNNPKTIFGYLTQALKLRKERGLKGCTIQSCDNIQENGHVTKKMLLSYVEVAEPSLLGWIEQNVSFPNSMVDRITPVTAQSDIDILDSEFGIQDQWPVVCEPFKQWVIEDNFIEGRPNWEDVGAQFVKNVAPYEVMKLSLLNAGHSVLGVLGALVGYNTIDEVVNDKAIKTFLASFMDKEVIPVLNGLEGVDLVSYKKSLIERFGNINIKDQVSRICSESSAKLPKFLLPTAFKQLEINGSIEHIAFVIAAWAIYSKGVDEKGLEIDIKDAMRNELYKQALSAVRDPKIFLEFKNVFGDLVNSEKFVTAYTKSYNNIVLNGVKKCVEEFNGNVKIEV